MLRLEAPNELSSVVALLPAAASELRQVAGPGRPWFVRYGSREAILRRNDPTRFRAFQFPPERALASIGWLHEFLRDLATSGFIAPEPIGDLGGKSIAMVDGAIWELLSYVPGRPMDWSDVEMYEAGRLLARFHESSIAVPSRSQRPGSLPVETCRPTHSEARKLTAQLENELADIGHQSAARAVVHGDATQSNVVVSDARTFHLIDFALAYQEALLFDLGSALWRNGRSGPDTVTYEPTRIGTFVRGYDAVRRLAPAESRAVVVYMKGRGIQLQHRLELRQGSDETVMQRLLSIHAQQQEIEEAINQVLGDRP